jgi:hypothetical protein
MVIGFIGFFDATRDYTHARARTHTHTVLSHGLHQSSGNGFQQRTFAIFCDPDLFPRLKCSNSRLTDPPTNSRKL